MTTQDLAQRKKQYPGHFPTRMTKTGKYISCNRQQYDIVEDMPGFFRIKRYGGGKTSKKLKGTFTSYKRAEETLVSYLKHTDRRNLAVYPGSKVTAEDRWPEH